MKQGIGRNGRHIVRPQPNVVEAAIAEFKKFGEAGEAMFNAWYKRLAKGDRILAENIPTRRAGVPTKRVVDSHIWAKLDGPTRTRYLDRVKEELGV